MENEALDIVRELVRDVEAAYPNGIGLDDEEEDEGFWPDLYITYVKAKLLLNTLDEMRK